MTRKLVLRRESLARLESDELRDLAGAAITPQCPTGYCRTIRPLNCYVSQLIDPCLTSP